MSDHPRHPQGDPDCEHPAEYLRMGNHPDVVGRWADIEHNNVLFCLRCEQPLLEEDRPTIQFKTPTFGPAPESTTAAMRLVKAVADAISREEIAQLAGHEPRGGHGYYSTAINATIAALAWLGDEDRTWGDLDLEHLVEQIARHAHANAWRPVANPDVTARKLESREKQ